MPATAEVNASKPSDEERSAYPQRLRRLSKLRREFGTMADRYGHALSQMDPVGDALAEALRQNPRLFPLVSAAIENPDAPRTGLPDAALRFLDAIEARPAWLDPSKLRLAERTQQRLGSNMMAVLGAWSLVNGYHSSAAVKPLAFTGGLTRSAPRRLAETGRFLVEVCQTNGLERRGDGFQIAAKVRLMHSMVRRDIVARGGWRADLHGAPINQGDMLGTIMEFSALVIEGVRTMGFWLSAEEAESILHLWRYCGMILGVDSELLDWIETEEGARKVAMLMGSAQPGPDMDSIDLMQALRKVPHYSATGFQKAMIPILERLQDGLAHTFNGREIAEDLGIPNRRWRHLIHLLRANVRSREVLRVVLPRGDELAARFGNWKMRRDVARVLAGSEPRFGM